MEAEDLRPTAMAPPPDPRLHELFARTESVPALPAAVLEVLALARREDATLADLCAALAADPVLSTRLVRFARAPGTSASLPLQRALLELGFRSVQALALACALLEALPRAGRHAGLDAARLARQGLVRAASARALASCFGSALPDEAFLAGLSGALGQSVLARVFAREYEPVVRAAAEAGTWPGVELERQHLGFDQLDVGAALLAAYGLPPGLGQAVRHAHDPVSLPERAPAEVVHLARVLAIAAHASELLTQPSAPRSLGRVHALAQGWFGVSEERVDECLLALEPELAELSELFGLPDGAGRSHLRALEEARLELLRAGTR